LVICGHFLKMTPVSWINSVDSTDEVPFRQRVR
jgi:hypothetical protein